MQRNMKMLVGVLFASVAVLVNGLTVAQDVSVQISSREAYVGAPVVLQIRVANTKNYDLPDGFEIDGCDVRSGGIPSTSSNIRIYNGQRTESRSVTMRYLIIPRREGKFEIPELEVEVDGEIKKTEKISFVATKSETGDLLFVEVEGNKERVFVGEPLKLLLKIWIKPYSDRRNEIKLNIGQMWQMVSDQSSWGSFLDRIQELAKKRQRPDGRKVLREDEAGVEREYYLYELDATVYPTKPGKIDASDLQVVVDYPLALGRSRDMFDSFFNRGRLSVSRSRPIVVEAEVDSTTVLPIPTANQPAEYRGAVGRYQIVTEASPVNVDAGDPITLKIGVFGDGPMDLLQAPPLHELSELTSGFQVTDQSLAGFAQDDTKVFVTTVRPRDDKVTQIPAIPFAFFDPDKEEFETVYSKPIEIVVNQSETLKLDSIVSRSGARENVEQSIPEKATAESLPNWENDFSADVLIAEQPQDSSWWYFAIVPPVCWLAVLSGKLMLMGGSAALRLRPARSIALTQLKSAESIEGISDVLRVYVQSQTGADCPSPEYAVGKIRELGEYEVAIRVEKFFNGLARSSETDLDEQKREAERLIEEIFQIWTGRSKRRIQSRRLAQKPSGFTVSMFIFFLFAFHENVMADEQLQSFFEDASNSYRRGTELAHTNPTKSREAFSQAAREYSWIIDQGVHNSKLFLNLANSYAQCDERALAVLNYHRALRLDPTCKAAKRNLEFLKLQFDSEESKEVDSSQSIEIGNVGEFIVQIGNWIGRNVLSSVFAIASIVFWLLVLLKTMNRQFSVIGLASVSAAFLLVSGFFLFQMEMVDDMAIITADAIELKSADGEEFSTVARIESAAGKAVQIVSERELWMQVKTESGQVGWIPSRHAEAVKF